MDPALSVTSFSWATTHTYTFSTTITYGPALYLGGSTHTGIIPRVDEVASFLEKLDMDNSVPSLCSNASSAMESNVCVGTGNKNESQCAFSVIFDKICPLMTVAASRGSIQPRGVEDSFAQLCNSDFTQVADHLDGNQDGIGYLGAKAASFFGGNIEDPDDLYAWADVGRRFLKFYCSNGGDQQRAAVIPLTSTNTDIPQTAAIEYTASDSPPESPNSVPATPFSVFLGTAPTPTPLPTTTALTTVATATDYDEPDSANTTSYITGATWAWGRYYSAGSTAAFSALYLEGKNMTGLATDFEPQPTPEGVQIEVGSGSSGHRDPFTSSCASIKLVAIAVGLLVTWVM